MDIKKSLDASGVTTEEFAMLCGVTKNMVYKWVKGAKPHALRRDRITRLLGAIDLAVESGDLPLADEKITREEKIKAAVIANIKKVI